MTRGTSRIVRGAALGWLACVCGSAATAPTALREAFERTIYALRDSGDGSWRGENRAQRLTLEFNVGTVRLTHPKGGVDFRLASYGYGDRLAKPATARSIVKEDRLEYHRGNLTEWYLNGSQGLEQGFTFQRRPGHSRNRPLQIALAVTGDLNLSRQQGAVLFSSNAGGVVMRYAGLTARDARGRTLPSRLEVRGREIRIVVDDREARYPLVVDPTWSQQQVPLTASDGYANDLFGTSIAMSADTAVIGVPGGYGGKGAAYVFIQSSGTWNYQATLTVPGGLSGDSFGFSVAISGNTVVVGAPGTNNGQGTAYAFVQGDGTWSAEGFPLVSAEGGGAISFGSSVALDGSTVLVGANNGNGGMGAAYVFTLNGDEWTEQAQLLATLDGGNGDGFGGTVALSGTIALIAAPGHFGTGAVYAFVGSGSTWSQQQEITPSDSNAGSFGDSVSLSGSTALIGAPQYNVDGAATGAAYVFTLSQGTWSQQQLITVSDGADGDQFGFAASVNGALAFVGAPTRNGSQGSVFAIALIDGTWTIQQELSVTDPDGNGLFGASVAVVGGVAIAGAPNHTVGSNNSQGIAYVYQLPPASLSLSAAHSTPTFQAGPGAISLTVANTGGPTADTATVSDTIGSGLTINSVSPGCSITGQVVTCTLAAGASAASTVFNLYVTASATAGSSISNMVTLTDNTDTVTSGNNSDAIAVGTELPLMDSSFTQLMLSGSTDNGTCAAGNRTLTATDQLHNTSGSTLTDPYAVIGTLSQGNTLLSQSADSPSVANGATVTFTFHIQLASCATFQLLFDVRSN